MDPYDALRAALESGSVLVTIKPGKRESRILSTDPYVIEIAAKPIEGAANDELLAFLKRRVRACRIVSGHRSRTKRIERQ